MMYFAIEPAQQKLKIGSKVTSLDWFPEILKPLQTHPWLIKSNHWFSLDIHYSNFVILHRIYVCAIKY